MTADALDTSEEISAGFAELGASVALHAIDLRQGGEVAVDADRPMVAASIFKALAALEFYDQAQAGEIDAGRLIDIDPSTATPGPTGVSNFEKPARLSLGDLAYLMMTVSDNSATDILLGAVGLEHLNARARRCGCEATTVVGSLADLLQQVAADLGQPSYADLLAAQSGAMGPEIKARTTDPANIVALRALDPALATRTTARDMTTLLSAIWANTAASPQACAKLRQTMRQQVTRRLEPALSDGGALWAKSGGLFGVVRNEIGVIEDRDGGAYAVAVLSHAAQPFVNTAALNREIGNAAATAIGGLRGGLP